MSIKEQRSHHIGFCLACVHKKRTLEHGVVCTLTDKIADFDEECPSFEVDISEVQKAKKTHKKYLEENYPLDRHAIEEMITDYTYSFMNTKELSEYRPSKKTAFRESDTSDLNGIFIFGAIALVSFLYFLFNLDQPISLVVTLGSIIGSAVCSYRYLNKDYKVKIRITEKGIQEKHTFVAWSEMIDYVLLTEVIRNNNHTEYKHTLLVLTISGSLKFVSLDHLDGEPETIVRTIQDHRKLYYHDTY
ncbi:hypothetical protein [uncultured Dokdonia sp.]|uniref:hypothetical protein n=1 Tax=uncultured Dokdonia sp. TaxID=575653 RepID=UPI00261EBCED|nr:hypothetical protein [uncultured Dokdonia sp.]